MDLSGAVTSGVRYALAAAVVSGGAVFVNGLAVRRFDDPTVYTTAKNLIAGAILTCVLLAWRRSEPTAAPPSASVRMRLALVALIGGAVPFVLFFEGLSRATSTNAAFIHKTLVIWVAIGAAAVLSERVTAVHAGAIGLLLAGHLVLGGQPPIGLGTGEIMILTATLLWAAEVLVVKRLLGDVPPGVAAATRMAGGSALLVMWLVVRGDIAGLGRFTVQQWGWLVLTGVTLSIFVGTWYRALALAPAIDVTAILVLGAVITGLLNSGFRGVPLTVDSYGYVLLAAGALVVAVAGRRTPSARTPSTGTAPT